MSNVQYSILVLMFLAALSLSVEDVQANNEPTASIVSVSPSPAMHGAMISFDGSASDSDGNITAYEWNSSLDGFLSAEEDFSSNELTFGIHEITFRVQDDDGVWSESQRSLEVYTKPVANAGENITVKVGETIQFNGQGSDLDGQIVFHEWDFDGDGFYEWSSSDINHDFGGGLSSMPMHYNDEGKYTVVLRVTDNDGRTATDSITVTVEGEGFLPAPSILAALGVLLAIAKRRKY